MYTLDTPIEQIKGIGANTAARLQKSQIHTVKDLLLIAPLRYLDATNFRTIAQLTEVEDKTLVTIKARVINVAQFKRGTKTIQTAIVRDNTANLKLIFFNSRHVLTSLKKGQIYFFSGRYSKKYKNLTQPKFEVVRDEQIHTGRLVPYYSSKLKLAQGTIRRLMKHILDHLEEIPDVLSSYIKPQTPTTTITSDSLSHSDADQNNQDQDQPLKLNHTFYQLHFPKSPSKINQARQRLALEEILSIIDYSHASKHYLLYQQKAKPITQPSQQVARFVNQLPFKLTRDQLKALTEILQDIRQTHPMNRLLMGDVGTGKTVVAGIVGAVTATAGHHVVLIAPTNILAQQHYTNLQQLFPNIRFELVTARHRFQPKRLNKPRFFIGTHSLINQLQAIKPALVIYDEQQKFGVWQRGVSFDDLHPHTLNMTATPIPRSLMLTVFAYVSLSSLKTHPNQKKPIKTSLLPHTQKTKLFSWLKDQLLNSNSLALVVAPFIDPSYHEALENVQAVTILFDQYHTKLPEINIGLLHGRLSQTKKDQVIHQLKTNQIQLLVATPMVEVGLDLPRADIMIIESAERFGLSSLHQLRGRVGRRGQSAFCLLVPHTDDQKVIEKLHHFSQLDDGEKIAELDLKYRGSGDIFGTNQHGLANLRFASWLSPALIQQAQTVYQQLPKTWQSFLKPNIKVGVSQLN